MLQSLINVERFGASDILSICALSKLRHLELGDCANTPPSLFSSLCALGQLTSLRLERAQVSSQLGELSGLTKLRTLELVDVQLKKGFGDGMSKLNKLQYSAVSQTVEKAK